MGRNKKEWFYGDEGIRDDPLEFEVTVARNKIVRQTAKVKVKAETASVAMEEAEEYCRMYPEKIRWKDKAGTAVFGDLQALDSTEC